MKRTELKRKKPWRAKIKPREPRTPPDMGWQGAQSPDEMEMRGCSSMAEQPPSKRRGTGSSPVNSTTLKRARPKSTPARQAARGKPCLIRLPGCAPGADHETVVLCHYALGGISGGALKSPDEIAAFGCWHCHDVVDGRLPPPVGYTRTEVRLAFAEAVFRTWLYMKDLHDRK